MDEQKSLLRNLTPQASFIFGAAASMSVLFIVGFFILLSVVLSDKTKDAGAVDKGSEVAGEQAAAQNPPAQQPINLAPVTDADWSRGPKDARITLVEFSDVDCPYCGRFHPTVMQLLAEYPNDVRWIYRHFPLPSLHPNATIRAEAAECAGSIGGNDGFWSYADALYENQGSGGDIEELARIAGIAGIDQTKLRQCVTDGTFKDKVQTQAQQAVSAGGQGTPYTVFLYDGEKIPVSGAVPYEQIKSFVDNALAS